MSDFDILISYNIIKINLRGRQGFDGEAVVFRSMP